MVLEVGKSRDMLHATGEGFPVILQHNGEYHMVTECVCPLSLLSCYKAIHRSMGAPP